MNDYQKELVAAGKRFESSVYDDVVAVYQAENWANRQRYTEAEAVVVANMLLKGAAELARRREGR